MKAISRISDTLGASGVGQRSLFYRTQKLGLGNFV
jgi:hypothetical protein